MSNQRKCLDMQEAHREAVNLVEYVTNWFIDPSFVPLTPEEQTRFVRVVASKACRLANTPGFRLAVMMRELGRAPNKEQPGDKSPGAKAATSRRTPKAV